MTQGNTKLQQALRLILTYTLWLASAALSLWAVLWLRIVLLLDLPMAIPTINPWALSAIDKFGTVLLGALWLVFVVLSEPYFRRLLNNELPIINVVKVFALEGLLLGVAYGAHLLI